MKKGIIGLIIGLSLGSIGVYAAYKYHANEVSYTPSNSNFNVNNVESAINDLYNIADKNFEFAVLGAYEYCYNYNGIMYANSYLMLKKDGTIIKKTCSSDLVNDSDGYVTSTSGPNPASITVTKSGYYSVGTELPAYYNSGSSLSWGNAYITAIIYYGETNPLSE